MRSVTGTAPSIFDPALVTAESLSSAGLFASAGTYAATKLAATPLPEVKRNLRRVGFGGRGLGSSSDIGPPFESKRFAEVSCTLRLPWRSVEQFAKTNSGCRNNGGVPGPEPNRR